MLSRFTNRAATVAHRSIGAITGARAARVAQVAQPARTQVQCRGLNVSARLLSVSPTSAPIVATTDSLPPSNTQALRNNSIVITAAGPDRAGIVHDMTKLLTNAGANVEESRMSILGNDFAILLRVTVPDSVDAAKLKSLLAADFSEFAIGVRPTQNTATPFSGPVRILSVMVEGPDQPGIVQTLTKIFVDGKGSVRDLDTDCSNAPFAGYKIFQLKAVVAFPMDTDLEGLESALHQFEDAYGFDVQVQEGMNQDVDEEMDEDEEGEEEEEEEDEEEEPAPRRSTPGAGARRPGVAAPAASARGPPARGPTAAPARPGAAPARGPATPAPRGPAAPARGPAGPASPAGRGPQRR